jgi:hypothetical protein
MQFISPLPHDIGYPAEAPQEIRYLAIASYMLST